MGATMRSETVTAHTCTALLDAVRAALDVPFADPVTIAGVTVPRSEARAAERLLGKVINHGT